MHDKYFFVYTRDACAFGSRNPGLDVANDVPWVQPRPPCWWRRALRSCRALHRRRSTTAVLWRADIGSPAVRSCRSTHKRGRGRAPPRASPCQIRVAPAWPGHSRGDISRVPARSTDGSGSRMMRSANAFSYGEIDEWLAPRAAGEQKADIRLRRGAARIEMATPVMTIARPRDGRSILIAAFLILARITERAADPTMAVTASRKRSAALRGAPFQPRGAQRNRPHRPMLPLRRNWSAVTHAPKQESGGALTVLMLRYGAASGPPLTGASDTRGDDPWHGFPLRLCIHS